MEMRAWNTEKYLTVLPDLQSTRILTNGNHKPPLALLNYPSSTGRINLLLVQGIGDHRSILPAGSLFIRSCRERGINLSS